jgi:hypothetical protein
MPDKRLVAHELQTDGGEFCALGVLGSARGIDLRSVDPEDAKTVANLFDIAPALAREIVYENDEAGRYNETPERRWERMRSWVAKQIRVSAA